MKMLQRMRSAAILVTSVLLVVRVAFPAELCPTFRGPFSMDLTGPQPSMTWGIVGSVQWPLFGRGCDGFPDVGLTALQAAFLGSVLLWLTGSILKISRAKG